MPAGAVYVGRPTKWGNPYAVGGAFPTAAEAIAAYRDYLARSAYRDEIREELAGKDLACWCKPGAPCHADVLLEIANEQPSYVTGAEFIAFAQANIEPRSDDEIKEMIDVIEGKA